MINTVERAYELAERKEMSLFKVCRDNGINYSTITTTKRRCGQLNVVTIELLCEAMGITMAEFFEEPERRCTEDNAGNRT